MKLWKKITENKKSLENKHEVYKGKYCMKKLLTKQQHKSYENAKICYIM